MSDFDKFLEDIDKAPMPEAGPEPTAEPEKAPEGPPDPLAHLIGHTGSLQEKSPWDAMLDEMAASDEAKDLPEPEPDFGNHDWKTIKDAIYEDDFHQWRCQRCFREIRVNREETLAQACARQNLNPDCSVQVAQEVMDS